MKILIFLFLRFFKGDIIEEAHDVELNNNASFYRAILAIHKENYTYVLYLQNIAIFGLIHSA